LYLCALTKKEGERGGNVGKKRKEIETEERRPGGRERGGNIITKIILSAKKTINRGKGGNPLGVF